MKKLIGALIALLCLAFITVLVLRIWGITIVSLQSIVRSALTLLVLGLTIVILIILYGAFYRNDTKNYNRKVGNKAHPKL